MKILEQAFHILTGGLEFIEICAKLDDNIDWRLLVQSMQSFAKYNGINIFIMENLPNIMMGKDIYITRHKEENIIMLKALHNYYDGMSISKFFSEVDNIYRGQQQETIFQFKTPIENTIANTCIEIGANLLMNQESKPTADTLKIQKPEYTLSNITSGDLIRKIQHKEKKDMILLCSKSKLDNTDSNDSVIESKLTVRYVKYGEDFKEVLKNSTILEQTLRFSIWLASNQQVLFLNNLSSIPLPSFIKHLVCLNNRHANITTKIKTLIAYPRTKESDIIEIYQY